MSCGARLPCTTMAQAEDLMKMAAGEGGGDGRPGPRRPNDGEELLSKMRQGIFFFATVRDKVYNLLVIVVQERQENNGLSCCVAHNAEMPIASKRSLQRFFQKRKERYYIRMPYSTSLSHTHTWCPVFV